LFVPVFSCYDANKRTYEPVPRGSREKILHSDDIPLRCWNERQIGEIRHFIDKFSDDLMVKGIDIKTLDKKHVLRVQLVEVNNEAP
jgi:hypothetical protein